jgi:hypothetical protein
MVWSDKNLVCVFEHRRGRDHLRTQKCSFRSRRGADRLGHDVHHAGPQPRCVDPVRRQAPHQRGERPLVAHVCTFRVCVELERVVRFVHGVVREVPEAVIGGLPVLGGRCVRLRTEARQAVFVDIPAEIMTVNTAREGSGETVLTGYWT